MRNKPLKLGIDTVADEDGKAVHETCYTKRLADAGDYRISTDTKSPSETPPGL